MKPYVITRHAIEQSIKRLGRSPENAEHDLLQRMQVARYQGMDGQARIFDHDKSRTRFVVARDEDIVITVYSMDTEKPLKKFYPDAPKVTVYNAIIEKARVVIGKEIVKARRQFTTESRKLTLAEAEIGFEIATLALNKARAKNPLTQASIAARINELEAGRQAVFAELLTVKERFEQMRKDAESFIGGVSK